MAINDQRERLFEARRKSDSDVVQVFEKIKPIQVATLVEDEQPVIGHVFNNATSLAFSDISSERYRVYVFGEKEVRIDYPQFLNVSKNGHRVFDSAGVSHYIPQGWIHLYWAVKPGQPNFVK